MPAIESNHEELARIKQKVAKRIRQLASSESLDIATKETILSQLAKLITRVGAGEDDIKTLIEIVLSSFLPSTEKSAIVRDLLVPRPSIMLPTDLIYRIVSQIGVPQKNDSKKELKRLSTALQLQLLEWLVASIHLFGEDVFKTLNRMLPLLFNYLPFEYLRSYIANLIFLSLLNSSASFKTYKNKRQTHRIPSIKPWHIQLVVNLYLKFPLDDYLRALVVLFKRIKPQLDYARFGFFDFNNNLSQLQVFAHPNPEYLAKLEELQSKDHSLREYPAFKSSSTILARNLDEYSEFNQATKRRKRNRTFAMLPKIDTTDLDIISSENANFRTLQSVKDLILNFNDLSRIKVNEMFRDNGNNSDKLKKLNVALKLITNLENQQDILQKINYYIRLSFLDDNLTVAELERLCSAIKGLLQLGASTLDLTLIKDFIYGRYSISPIVPYQNPRLIAYEKLKLKIYFLRYLHVVDFSEFELFLKPTFEFFNDITSPISMKVRKKELFCLFVDELTLLFRIQLESGNTSFLNTISKTLTLFYESHGNRYQYYGTSEEYCTVKVFDFVKSIDIGLLNEHFTDDAIVPPPLVVYSFLLKGDPFLASEICGYIAHTKQYTYKTELKRALQNSYIMDTVNYIWRDKALHLEPLERSSEKGLLFHPEFTSSVNSLDLFNYSNMITPGTIGNLFVSPAWAYISAQIVWKLEDEDLGLTTRHEGPISKHSVSKILLDSSKKWLKLNYDDLKLKMLRELDTLGFKGVADLLFNSLQTLQNQRNQTVESNVI